MTNPLSVIPANAGILYGWKKIPTFVGMTGFVVGMTFPPFRHSGVSRNLIEGVMEKIFCVYILTNKKDGVLYVGVTSDLLKRIYEHKNKLKDGFSKKYNLTKLVYYEVFDSAEKSIHREKCVKEWKREWKIELIEKMNPDWRDLYEDIVQ